MTECHQTLRNVDRSTSCAHAFRCAEEFIRIVNAEEQLALTVERRVRRGREQLRQIQQQLRQRRRLKAVQMQITERLKRVEALRDAREQDAKRQVRVVPVAGFQTLIT